MKNLIISRKFFEALEDCPPIYRLMWMNWLAKPDLLFIPNFCEKIGYREVPLEKVKECYAIGMAHIGEGFIDFNEQNPAPKEKKSNKKVPDEIVVEIITYLNNAAGTSFRPSSKETATLINSRISDGFTKEDFFTVIDKKVKEWKDTERAVYLRPITLFKASKFESYLNQPEYGKKQTTASVTTIANAVNEAKSRLFS